MLSLLHTISALFTGSPTPSAPFYLYNYYLLFYLSPFLSLSLSLSYYCYTVSNTAVHLTSSSPFNFYSLSLHLTAIVLLSHSLSFFCQYSPPHFHPMFSPPPLTLVSPGFSLSATRRSGGSRSPFFLTLTPLAH